MVEVQKHHEQVQPKVEKQNTSSEEKSRIEYKSKKIAKTPIGEKVGEVIKSKTGADEAGKILKGILHLNEKKEGNEKEKKVSRKEILKVLDSRIEKTLPKGQSIDNIAKILKKPDGTKFQNLDEAKDFLREQFLKGEIHTLNKKQEYRIKGKDGKEVVVNETKFDYIKRENKDIKQISESLDKLNPNLTKELLALYGKESLAGYSDILSQKKPKTLQEAYSIIEAESKRRAKEAGKSKEGYSEYIDKVTKNSKIAGEMIHKMAGYKGISESETRNIQPESLELTGDKMTRTLNLIKHFEGFVSVSYWDYKQWTWGYGTKAPGKGARITKAEATRELQDKVSKTYYIKNYISEKAFNKLSENQVAALTSFIYNLGPGKMKHLKPLVEGYANGTKTSQDIANYILKPAFATAGGKTLKGLVKRRKTEAQLFLGENIKSGKEYNSKASIDNKNERDTGEKVVVNIDSGRKKEVKEILENNNKKIPILYFRHGNIDLGKIDKAWDRIKKTQGVFIFREGADLSGDEIKSITQYIKNKDKNKSINIYIDQEGGGIHRYIDFNKNERNYNSLLKKYGEGLKQYGIDNNNIEKVLNFISNRSHFPSQAEIGKEYNRNKNEQFLKAMAYLRLKTLQEHGISTFGFVCDLEQGNGLMNKWGRSFSGDINDYKKWADSMLEASKRTGVSLYLKHFPGHGLEGDKIEGNNKGRNDSHEGVYSLMHKTDKLKQNAELFDYILNKGNGNISVMVGHMLVSKEMKPYFDSILSKAKTILTDAINMAGFTKATGYISKDGSFFSTDYIAKNFKDKLKVVSPDTGIV